MGSKILVVDDEPVIRDLVRDSLGDDHDVRTAPDAASGLAALRDEVRDVLITDVRMPGGDGQDLARKALAEHPDLAVIVISGHGSLDDFVAFLRIGVTDYLLKPFSPASLRLAVQRAVELRRLRAENSRLRAALPRPMPRFERLVGESSVMQAVKEQIARVAPTDSTVLVTGSSGTGKELAARAVHDLSPRSDGPFIPVNCGALPETLLESELFGHAKGAFTGAERSRRGLFEEAHGGTLFLDEIGATTEAVQVRLLRVLSTREVTRLGDERTRSVNVRIVAATNADVASLVEQGTFREDLLYRLRVFPIEMPELADRDDDVELLAVHLLDACCKRIGRPAKRFHPRALERFRRHSWPGNVRELENCIERAVILAGDNEEILPDDVLLGEQPPRPAAIVDLPDDGLVLPDLLADIENQLIRRALERTGDNKQAAARLLNLRRTTLVQKLRRKRMNAGG